MQSISILLADDHALVRAGIKSLLGAIEGITVVGEARNGREAIEYAVRFKPQIVLLDITMPDLNGLEAAKMILEQAPETKIIILSMHSNEEYVLQSIKAGASGYLLKDSAPTELELAVRSVASGDTYLSPSVSRHVIDSYRKRVNDLDDTASLTPRQRQILTMIAQGKTIKEIAYELNISGKTVETHKALLMDRLDLHDIPSLVRYALKSGLITLES